MSLWQLPSGSACDSAQLCLGEQSLTFSLKLSCGLLLSTSSQGLDLAGMIQKPAQLLHSLTVPSHRLLDLPKGCPLSACLLSICFGMSPWSALPADRLATLARANTTDLDLDLVPLVTWGV